MMKILKCLIIVLNIIFCANLASTAQDLPDDFPGIYTYKNGETGEGYVFLTISSDVEGTGYYIFMIDDDGKPIKYKKLQDDYSYDLKVQPNGLMSYAQFLSHHTYTGGGNCIHMIMDENMNNIDSFQLKNGYIAEAHDFQLLPNGHALAFGYYITRMDLSDILPDGKPDALVSGGIIQEFDQDKNVVWQWRSWDHYNPETFNFGHRIGGEVISAFHLNTINMDRDNNLILASPSWSKKINRQTGEIMWHLGGDENQFSFAGVDSLEGVGDVTGHAIHRLANGNFLIYDNGPRKGEGTSEAHEYRIDEKNFVAEKIMTFTPDTAIAGWHRGNAQRLPNGNTMVGWGGARGEHVPICTEFDTAGNIVFKVYFDDPLLESYRAVRYPYPPSPKANALFDLKTGGKFSLISHDSTDTGVGAEILSPENNSNRLSLTLYEYAPRYPRFAERAPRVVPMKIILQFDTDAEINGRLILDAQKLGIRNPEDITVYFRDVDGKSLFSPVPTTYSTGSGFIAAEFSRQGEYILTYPDVEPVPIPPLIDSPKNSQIVNYSLPAKIEWSPGGFFNFFHLQVASDSAFENLVVDTFKIRSTVFMLTGQDVDREYFWRVKTYNEAGESNWSDTANFITRAPYVRLKIPSGGESWTRNMKHFIEWEDNLDEDIILELYHEGQKLMTIDTAEAFHTAYHWLVPAGLDSSCSYYIKIRSMNDPYIRDYSRETFSIEAQCEPAEVPFMNVLSPDGGEKYSPGDTLLVKWMNNTGKPANLSLHREGQKILSLSSQMEADTFQWIIPAEFGVSDDYRIKISADGSAEHSDMSNGTFSIGNDINSSDFSHKDIQSRFVVYPNPVDDILRIDFAFQKEEYLSIRISDLTGKILESTESSRYPPGKHHLQHNMAEYKAGTYIMSFITGKGVESKMVICH